MDKSRPLLPQIPPDVDIVHFHFRPDFDLDRISVGPTDDRTRQYECLSGAASQHGLCFARPRAAAQIRSIRLQWFELGGVWSGRPVAPALGFPFPRHGRAARQECRGSHPGGAGRQGAARRARRQAIQFPTGNTADVFAERPFHGMVGDAEKFSILNGSEGLIFPVRWHEPFGLAVIESLYFGCPVFATPYGALPGMVPDEVGRLSPSRSELIEAVRSDRFDRRACHEHARDDFEF